MSLRLRGEKLTAFLRMTALCRLCVLSFIYNRIFDSVQFKHFQICEKRRRDTRLSAFCVCAKVEKEDCRKQTEMVLVSVVDQGLKTDSWAPPQTVGIITSS